MEPQNSPQNQPPSLPTSPLPVPPIQEVTTQPPPLKKKSILPKILMVLLVLIIVGAATAGGYIFGKRSVKPAPAQQTTQAGITIPQGATVTAECIDGLGKQYVLPADIPFGPIYNVHDGKVTGIEYMVGAAEILKDPNRFMNMPGFNHQFDHINIDYLPSGHAGNINDHFHVDLFTISKEEAAGIKCATENSVHMH
jgi:hypothetical protein